MQVLFVRHAESLNNYLKSMALDSGHARLRYPDPHLSETGYRQLAHVGPGITRVLARRPSPILRNPSSSGHRRRVHVAVSPMKRALLTAVPIVHSLQVPSDNHILTCVEIVPFLFEKGGCYSEVDGEGIRSSPGLTAREAMNLLPGSRIQDPSVMEDGWWKSPTRETQEEMEQRITRTLGWIRRIACTQVCDVLILVTHEGFSCACIRRFLKCEQTLLDWLYNASFSSLTLIPAHTSLPPPSTTDGDIHEHREVHVILDYLNSVEHLPLEILT